MPVEVFTALAGGVSSFLSGLLGIGGGIVLTPLLLYAAPIAGVHALPVKIITGLTIVQAISGGMIGTQRHWRYGNVSLRLLRIMGPSGAVASLAGALLSGIAPDRVILALFAVFAIVGSLALALPQRGAERAREEVADNVPGAIAIAVVIGFFGGMVGIGAIAFIIAALIYVLRVPPRLAIGTSLAIGLTTAVAGLIGKAATAQIDPALAAIVFGAAVISAPLGAWISVRTHPRALMWMLAALVFVSGLRMAWQAITGV